MINFLLPYNHINCTETSVKITWLAVYAYISNTSSRRIVLTCRALVLIQAAWCMAGSPGRIQRLRWPGTLGSWTHWAQWKHCLESRDSGSCMLTLWPHHHQLFAPKSGVDPHPPLQTQPQTSCGCSDWSTCVAYNRAVWLFAHVFTARFTFYFHLVLFY